MHDFIMSHEDIEKAFRNAMNNGILQGIKCGVDKIDDCFRLDRGKLVVATGIPNMGKSEFVDFLCVQYNKLYGMRTLYFSPENQPLHLHIDKLYRKFECKRFDKEEMFDARSVAVRRYIYDNFRFFNYEYSVEQVLNVAEEQIMEHGIDILVIDSHNKLLHDTSRNETDVIGRELDALERFAKRLNIIIILVAHPRKVERNGKEGEYVIPSAYDINGSANFYNKADYVFAVHRVKNPPEHTIVKVYKVKFNNYGGQGEITLGYNLLSGNYYNYSESDIFATNQVQKAPAETPFHLDTYKKSGAEWLNVNCSYSDKVFSSTVSECNLWWFLTTTDDTLQQGMARVRAAEGKERQALKSSLLPIITPSVVVKDKRDSEHISGYTGIICIDIDKKDNEDVIDKVPAILKSLPYVAMAQRSASGEGYCAFIPIKYHDSILEHFYALEQEFKEKGITIDKSCKDAVRARYYSYDEERYVNPSCTEFVKRYRVKQGGEKHTYTVSSTPLPQFSKPTITADLIAELDKECKGIEGLNICDTHQAWVEVGSALAKELGEQGRHYFHLLSAGHPNYSPSETNSKYDELLPRASGYGYSKGTIFHHIKRAKMV